MVIGPVDAIAELFGSAGARDYLGEPVTVAAHLLQAGTTGRSWRSSAPLPDLSRLGLKADFGA